MRVQFLLGPAGSGKTFRCLQDARHELGANPSGPPLLLIAPKQTTFQLERQLLADDKLAGYTRLHILSFERLAYFLFQHFRQSPPALLAEEGRVMVLRALLAKNRSQLKVFRASARLTGFAQQLGELIGELQRHQLTAETLRDIAARLRAPEGLASKLEDVAALLREYLAWLDAHQLQDSDRLLAAATTLLQAARPLTIQQLWVDGFAEWSPQEFELLLGLLPFCQQATFTFCLDQVPATDLSWLSASSLVRKTFADCRRRLEQLPTLTLSVETLPRVRERSRFAESAALQRLERCWDERIARSALESTAHSTPRTRPRVRPESPGQLELPGWQALTAQPPPAADRDYQPHQSDALGTNVIAKSLRLVRCTDFEGEALVAAREALAHVRQGGRYRDIAVLTRKLDVYYDSLQRVFKRYGIPFFIDRRESVVHHPLAELTRSALRTVLFQWKHEEWFAALKTGLMPSTEQEIDELENEALARGWKGNDWHSPLRVRETSGLRESPEALRQVEERLEKLRRRLVPPFETLAVKLGSAQNRFAGSKLAEAIRYFWNALDVEAQLLRWAQTDPAGAESGIARSVHLTVWEQMNDWLDDLELAFRDESLAFREWLPILEAGLASLSVGAIPPVLDQVLIGSIERSRSPDIRLAIVVGLNETIFPAPPPPLPLLTDADRAQLEQNDLLLATSPRRCLSRERFYAYLAFTRARERLVLTSALHDPAGAPLNPSPFLNRILELFPAIEWETENRALSWRASEHPGELIAPFLAMQRLTPAASQRLAGLPHIARALNRLSAIQQQRADQLPSELARALYGPVLRTSVSRLEDFAACPFKFFVKSGLRAEERRQFELDAREQGSFQHEVLAEFHRRLKRENKRWRDLSPQEARERVGSIAHVLIAGYRDGLLQATEESRFLARVLTDSLQDFVETLVGWMEDQYQFDPGEVELPFGHSESAPAWQLDLGEGLALAIYGRIDRVDLWREENRPEALCLVIDYKSRFKSLDSVLVANGIQLQLLTYLNVLRDWPNPQEQFHVNRLIPAGVFYVNLRGRYESGKNRFDALAGAAADRKLAYQHSGRFDLAVLPQLDARPSVRKGDQFNFRLTQSGELHKADLEGLSSAAFARLLEASEAQLKRMSRQILAGIVGLNPYKKSGVPACRDCQYQAICRIDPWTQSYRVLRKEEP